jgi:predicted membrane-bound spermidine synthase
MPADMAKRTNPAPAIDTEMSSGLRGFVYGTAAITGACVLIVEILGAKMLSPYFGTSHFVWTAQIAVTLLALAAGYYLGGRWVDHSPRLGNIYLAILGAAVYLAATVPLVRGVSFACLKMNLALGSLLASLFLFLVPLALLAMTGPFLVRILTKSVSQVGGNVGRLTSISTLGSVAGTLLIGYVLIPRLPNSVTMLATAGVLVLLPIVYFFVWGRDQRPSAGITTALLLIACFAFTGLRSEWDDRVRYGGDVWIVRARTNSNFGRMIVIDDVNLWGTRRWYLNDNLVQNTYDPANGKSLSLFTELLHGLPHAYTANLQSALCIGMGTGIVPMMLAHDGVKVDVVEINPGVVPLAEEWFGFRPQNLRHLEIGDGRYFLNRSKEQYDAIVLDAFLGDSSPSHLMTKEAFAAVRDRMTPDGVLVMNTFGRGLESFGEVDPTALIFDRPADDFYTASLHDTLKAVFPHVRIHGSGNGNVFFVASMSPLKVHRPPAFDLAHQSLLESPDLTRRPQMAWDRVWRVPDGIGMVMTDDYNPIEYHDAAHRETTRKGLVAGIK